MIFSTGRSMLRLQQKRRDEKHGAGRRNLAYRYVRWRGRCFLVFRLLSGEGRDAESSPYRMHLDLQGLPPARQRARDHYLPVHCTRRGDQVTPRYRRQ